MNEIFLDTETTGLSTLKGDRIIEIAAVELIDHLPTGKFFHSYINPNRTVPIESTRIHNLTNKFVADKPQFSEVAKDFLSFIKDSALVPKRTKLNQKSEFGHFRTCEG